MVKPFPRWVTCIDTKRRIKATSVQNRTAIVSLRSGRCWGNTLLKNTNEVLIRKPIRWFPYTSYEFYCISISFQCTNVLNATESSDHELISKTIYKRIQKRVKCSCVRTKVASASTRNSGTWNRTWRRTTATGTRSSVIVTVATESCPARFVAKRVL